MSVHLHSIHAPVLPSYACVVLFIYSLSQYATLPQPIMYHAMYLLSQNMYIDCQDFIHGQWGVGKGTQRGASLIDNLTLIKILMHQIS